MNKDKAAAMLPIITAFAEGKQIQFRTTPDQQWKDATSLTFNYDARNYRIKPDPPRSIFEVQYSDGTMYGQRRARWAAEALMEDLRKSRPQHAPFKLVEYVEKVDA